MFKNHQVRPEYWWCFFYALAGVAVLLLTGCGGGYGSGSGKRTLAGEDWGLEIGFEDDSETTPTYLYAEGLPTGWQEWQGKTPEGRPYRLLAPPIPISQGGVP